MMGLQGKGDVQGTMEDGEWGCGINETEFFANAQYRKAIPINIEAKDEGILLPVCSQKQKPTSQDPLCLCASAIN